MILCTALRKMSLVLSSRKLRQPMIWLCHAIRFLSLVVSCACSVSLRFSSDRYLVQLHQLTAMVVLYGLDFILQPFDGFLVRGNLTAQILYFIFQGF